MKKMLTLVLAFALVAAVAIGGTLAYLSAFTQEVVNTFTVGKVNLTLDEKDVDNSTVGDNDRDTKNTYHLLPGSTYDKDPIVHVTVGSEACYVFVKVVNGLADAEQATVVGGYQNIADQMEANGWAEVSGNAGYYYKTVNATQAAAGCNLPVFEKVAIKGELTGPAFDAFSGATINVIACAVQSENLNVTAAFAACPTDFINAFTTNP